MGPSSYGHEAPDRAMEVLVIAQRTAEEHLRSTRLEAENIRSRALTSAGEVLRDAEAYAEDIRRKAERVLTEANNAAESVGRNAQERADEIEQRAMIIMSDARSRAERIGDDARLSAEELRRQVKAEYDDVLERLQAGRESLLRQIESLEQFDREYRLRLLGFMQDQMRALWADNPQVLGDPAEMPAEYPLA
jgi:cell division septum initiation protein DivIVA